MKPNYGLSQPSKGFFLQRKSIAFACFKVFGTRTTRPFCCLVKALLNLQNARHLFSKSQSNDLLTWGLNENLKQIREVTNFQIYLILMPYKNPFVSGNAVKLSYCQSAFMPMMAATQLSVQKMMAAVNCVVLVRILFSACAIQ